MDELQEVIAEMRDAAERHAEKFADFSPGAVYAWADRIEAALQPSVGGEVVESLRTLAGCAYQLAGYHDAPEIWLDRLSEAAIGESLPDADTLANELLPYAPDLASPAQADGFVLVPVGAAMLAAEVADDWLDLFPKIEGLEKYERYTYGPAVEQLRDEFRALTAAPSAPRGLGG